MRKDIRSPRRAWGSFWTLTVIAVISAGSLSTAARAPAGSSGALRVAVSGLLLLVTVTLAARVLVAVERARRRNR